MEHTPSNEDVAMVFDAIAELLEVSGENPFKIRAYRSAVRTLDTLEEPVAAIHARGDLRKIPGFGEAIAAKTQEILATGTCELYERLKTEAGPSASLPETEALPMPGALVAQGTVPVIPIDDAPADEDLPSPW